jgi:hypothetical protein
VKDKDYELKLDPSDEESSQSVAPPPPDFNLFTAAAATFPELELSTRKRGQKASNVSQLANVAKRQSEKDPKVSPQEICEGWTQHVKSVVDMPFCKASNGSRNSKC